MRLIDLPRNDVPAALAYLTQELDAGRELDADDVRTLGLLQDDPDRLFEDMAKLLAARGLDGDGKPKR